MPVIPAGGAGTRLWPLSRRSRPKFLLDLTGEGRSLLQGTMERLAPLTDQTPIVVTGVSHEAAVREQLGELGMAAVVLAEPSPRNSMPAIALAAALDIGETSGPGLVETLPRESGVGTGCELVLVIGGDGSILRAAEINRERAADA